MGDAPGITPANQGPVYGQTQPEQNPFSAGVKTAASSACSNLDVNPEILAQTETLTLLEAGGQDAPGRAVKDAGTHPLELEAERAGEQVIYTDLETETVNCSPALLFVIVGLPLVLFSAFVTHKGLDEMFSGSKKVPVGPVLLPDPSHGLNQFLTQSNATLNLTLCVTDAMCFYVAFPDSCPQLGDLYGGRTRPPSPEVVYREPGATTVVKCHAKAGYDFYQAETSDNSCEFPPPIAIETMQDTKVPIFEYCAWFAFGFISELIWNTIATALVGGFYEGMLWACASAFVTYKAMEEMFPVPSRELQYVGPVQLPDPSEGLNHFLTQSNAALTLTLCITDAMGFYVGFPDSCPQLGDPYGGRVRTPPPITSNEAKPLAGDYSFFVTMAMWATGIPAVFVAASMILHGCFYAEKKIRDAIQRRKAGAYKLVPMEGGLEQQPV
ncbi:hypothetical protein KFL_003300020 [Klebsormidium nitens]|uniref:Uncharacterized protein n=1 Tax=Klebsormidium nitens TaxID=105231 RepID=A0A1Y1ICC1_KLENI|nr:hypothetical protein KFL_003300020 [Klebsormidium nitens]|eukprot:GAQ87079.1 hypothetical protein KFL_003300020 [Klebsormidium nitens]